MLLLLAACGDDERTNLEPDAGDDPGPDAADDGCTEVTLGARDFQGNQFGQLTGVRYPVAPNLDGELPESLLIELYDSSTEGLPPLATGTFDLAVAPNDNLATCQHCVWLPVDWDGFSPLGTIFIATEGSITITDIDDPLSPVFAASTTEIVLREATLGETGSVLVEDGRCLRVPAVEFDTSPTPGADCLAAEDCGNPFVEVCSPDTYTCAAPECGEFHGCPEGFPVCMTQYGELFEGACYADCDPTAGGGCRDGEVCRQLGPVPTSGVCLRPGDGQLGETCETVDVGTSCEEGMTCTIEGGVCTNVCSFFEDDPGCQADNACNVLGWCDPESAGDPAAIGEDCGETAYLAQGCGSDGEGFRGICFSYYEDRPKLCEEACLGDQGCEDGEFCAMRFTSGLGVCKPNPVCGDGLLGEINEVCDDGNETDGDGCSDECQTVGYDYICTGAPTLAIGGNAGSTLTGWDGFQAGCQIGIARAELFQFEPPGRGRLRLTLDSATLQTMSVRTDCDAANTEQLCETNDPWDGNELIYQVTADGALTVMVSAYTVLEEGDFTLNAEWVAEDCGDSVIAGLEVCDDGNETSDDGCSADCRTIEYDYWCEQATVLEDSATGDNTGGPALYHAVCSNEYFGSGPDRLYTWTAPSAGTARFELEQGEADLVLAVYDGCGEPASIESLGCSAFYGPERVEVEVTAGQTLTVLVDGYDADDVGPYTLTAEMLP